MVFVEVTVGPKGQIVIPKVFRDNYGIFPGSKVRVLEKGMGLVIEKESLEVVEFLRESAKSIGFRGKIDADAKYDEMMEERLKHVLPGRRRADNRSNKRG